MISDRMIVDSLVHVTPDGSWFGRPLNATESQLLRDMDEAGIATSVVVALAGFIENRFVQDVCARHPDRLVAGLSFNPAAYETPRHALREFQTDVLAEGAHVLKLHPRLGGYDPLDSRCVAILEAAATASCPPLIWIDTLLYGKGLILQKPPVAALHELVSRFAPLTFVLLHGAGSELLRLAEAVRDCPNAFVDLSFTLTRYETSSVGRDIQFLLDTFDRRLLFGSDFPEVRPSTALAALCRLAAMTDPEKRENVLGRNLAQLLLRA
jgi:predicted TIM-barrel fold metal-dependent hydrolase